MEIGTALDDSASDKSLMLAYADGDTEAFETLYQRHRRGLYRYVLHSCGNEADAAEIYQDIWLKLVNGREAYQADAPFTAWLYRIAKNRLVDHYRQHGKIDTEEFDDQQSDITMIAPALQPDEVARVREKREVLQNALDTLPEGQRDVVLQRHVAGLSLAEMSKLNGEKAETVKSRLRYALVKLRSQLREQS